MMKFFFLSTLVFETIQRSQSLRRSLVSPYLKIGTQRTKCAKLEDSNNPSGSPDPKREWLADEGSNCEQLCNKNQFSEHSTHTICYGYSKYGTNSCLLWAEPLSLISTQNDKHGNGCNIKRETIQGNIKRETIQELKEEEEVTEIKTPKPSSGCLGNHCEGWIPDGEKAECGRRTYLSNILRGDATVTIGDYPWVAQICLSKDCDKYGAAVLINRWYVLTSKAAFDEMSDEVKKPKGVKVILSGTRMGTVKDLGHDIVLIKLEHMVPLHSDGEGGWAMPVCLPGEPGEYEDLKADDLKGKRVIAPGWLPDVQQFRRSKTKIEAFQKVFDKQQNETKFKFLVNQKPKFYSNFGSGLVVRDLSDDPYYLIGTSMFRKSKNHNDRYGGDEKYFADVLSQLQSIKINMNQHLHPL